MDGTHIPIKTPAENEGDCVNRKSFPSINLQIIYDATNTITNLEAKWPGSVDDAQIFCESALYNKFEKGKPGKHLLWFTFSVWLHCFSLNHYIPCVLTGQYNGLLLADRGYPCMPYMMTPYPDPEPGLQSRYNLALSKTRARVETTVGILKDRFQCMRGLRVTPDRACDITVACVVLHNIATITGEQHPAIPQADINLTTEMTELSEMQYAITISPNNCFLMII
uniref:DDE Tnp4 domain-containing protein n=1 Tax=Pygocentrus nattereri TaxID=42514 RepID=A0AAR2JYS2_PYGNA